ncbi:MAG: FkbM family methyltransferase [Verrucomicrobia bacterium]|nr:MAG: FkbM family methyltransferase [Verrucomicrobiota bacterium]
MSTSSVLHSAANKLYQYVFPIYRLLYAAYKTRADRAERELLKQILFPGAVVVDVGANIGIYSEFLSRCVGPTGLVHSFEPSPDNFRRLRVATRNLSNVRLSQAAVGERSGESKLYISNKLNVDHRVYQADKDSRRAIPTEMVTLNDYFKPGQRVDLIKIDIQGYELHALRGANRVLADNPNAKLLLEFWPYGLKQAGANWIELIDNLKSKNMAVHQVTKHGLVTFRPESVSESPDWYVNVFASSK